MVKHELYDLTDKLKDLTDEQYKKYVQELTGNYAKFGCFAWWGRPDDPENWYIHYTSNRDSGILCKANERVILEHFQRNFYRTKNKNWHLEQHSSSLCGYLDAIVIKVTNSKKEITKDFKEICKIIHYLEDYYPILNEDLYSEMEDDALIENIEMEAYSLKHKHDLPEDWLWRVIEYWNQHEPNKMENIDDHGGWLDRSDIELALRELEIIKDEIEVN